MLTNNYIPSRVYNTVGSSNKCNKTDLNMDEQNSENEVRDSTTGSDLHQFVDKLQDKEQEWQETIQHDELNMSDPEAPL